MYRPSALRSQQAGGPRLTTYGNKNKAKKKESNLPHPVLSHWERLEQERIKRRHERRDGHVGADANKVIAAAATQEGQCEDDQSDTGSSGTSRGSLSSTTDFALTESQEARLGRLSSTVPGTRGKIHIPLRTSEGIGGGAGCSRQSVHVAITTKASLTAVDNQDMFLEVNNVEDNDNDQTDMLERFDEGYDNDGEDADDIDEVLFRSPSLDLLEKLRSIRPSSQQSQTTTTPSSEESQHCQSKSRSSTTTSPSIAGTRTDEDTGLDRVYGHTKVAAAMGPDMYGQDQDGDAPYTHEEAPVVRRPKKPKGFHQQAPSVASLGARNGQQRKPIRAHPASLSTSRAVPSSNWTDDQILSNPFLEGAPKRTARRVTSTKDEKTFRTIQESAPADDDSPEVSLGKRMLSIEITPKRLLAKQRRMAATVGIQDDEHNDNLQGLAISMSPLTKARPASSTAPDVPPASPLAKFVSASKHSVAEPSRAATIPGSSLASRTQMSSAGRGGGSARRSIPIVSRPTLQDLVAVCDQWLCSSSSSFDAATTIRAGRTSTENEKSSFFLRDIPTFDQFVLENPALQTTVHKVGEASYSEVYTAVLPVISPSNADGIHDTNSNKKSSISKDPQDDDRVVLKVVPFLNQEQRKGPRGTSMTVLSDIYREVVMSTRVVRGWEGFMSSMGAIVVKGRYPKCFLDAWDEYKAEKGTESIRPGRYSSNQLYCILFMPFGGTDLEHYTLLGWKQAWAILTQICIILTTREQEPFVFEHRDLHWGNILITEAGESSVPLNCSWLPSQRWKQIPATLSVPTFGARVQIIDYTLARVNTGPSNPPLYMDLEDDQELFEGEGDLQFDIYRAMQHETGKDWAGSYPRTNVLWMHYLCKKLIHDKGLDKPKRKLKLASRKDCDQNNPLAHKDEYWFYERILRVVRALERDQHIVLGDNSDVGRESAQHSIQSLRDLLDILVT